MIARAQETRRNIGRLDAAPPTAEYGALLEGAFPKLKQFVRYHSGRVIRARECDTDIAQSVCREALADREHFRYGGERGMNQWLFTRAKRKIQDRVRFYTADKRDLARETPMQGAADAGSTSAFGGAQPADTMTPDRVVIDREQDGRLREAIENLPEDYRRVVTMARLEGVPHAEIARRLGRTEVATRKVLHRALARLAQSV